MDENLEIVVPSIIQLKLKNVDKTFVEESPDEYGRVDGFGTSRIFELYRWHNVINLSTPAQKHLRIVTIDERESESADFKIYAYLCWKQSKVIIMTNFSKQQRLFHVYLNSADDYGVKEIKMDETPILRFNEVKDGIFSESEWNGEAGQSWSFNSVGNPRVIGINEYNPTDGKFQTTNNGDTGEILTDFCVQCLYAENRELFIHVPISTTIQETIPALCYEINFESNRPFFPEWVVYKFYKE